MRTALAFLATLVCSILAGINFVFFAVLLVTKFLILYDNGRALLAIVILGANTFALGWLAIQASKQLGGQSASAEH